MMQMPEVSIITCTFRPGGLDISLAGMKDQTFKDFEYIIVDHRYERRHQEVMALAKDYNVNLIHVPEFRRNGKWAVLSSAFHTGFALARGRVVIMLVDWTYAPPGWIEAHWRHHTPAPAEAPRYVLGPYIYYGQVPELIMKRPFDFSKQSSRSDHKCVEEDEVLRGEIIPEVCAFKEGRFDPSWLPGLAKALWPHQDSRSLGAGPDVPFTYTHLKNESILREMVLKLNGVDIISERGGRMSIDTEFGLRVEQAGALLWWEPEALAHCVNPRHTVCRVMPFGADTERVEGRWTVEDCQRYYARREAEIRAGMGLRAPAPHSLEELSQRLEPWRTATEIDTSKLDVPDHEFFGGDVWPDTLYPT